MTTTKNANTNAGKLFREPELTGLVPPVLLLDALEYLIRNISPVASEDTYNRS